jgi:hypothetical protein
MKYQPHSVDIQPQPIGTGNTQALGSVSFGIASVGGAGLGSNLFPDTPVVTKQDEEKERKRLLAKQKKVNKKETEAAPKVDVISQQEFSEDLGGKSKKKGGALATLKESEIVKSDMSKVGGRKQSPWFIALKKWNESQVGPWKIPAKGTKAYDEVKAMMK